MRRKIPFLAFLAGDVGLYGKSERKDSFFSDTGRGRRSIQEKEVKRFSFMVNIRKIL